MLDHDGIKRSVVLIGEFHDAAQLGKGISANEQAVLDMLKEKNEAHPFRLLWETTNWNMEELIKEKGYEFVEGLDSKTMPFLFLFHAQEMLKGMGIQPQFAKFLPASHTLEVALTFAFVQLNNPDQRAGAKQLTALISFMNKIPKDAIKTEVKDMALRVAQFIKGKKAERYAPGLRSSYASIQKLWSDFDKKYFGKASTIGEALSIALKQGQIEKMNVEIQAIYSLLRDVENLLVILDAKEDLVVYGGFDHMVNLAALLEKSDATFAQKSSYERQIEEQAAKLGSDPLTQRQFAGVAAQLGVPVTIVKPQEPAILPEWISCWSHVLAHKIGMKGGAEELRSHYKISAGEWSLALKSGAELYQYRQGLLNDSYKGAGLPANAQTLVNEYLGVDSN